MDIAFLRYTPPQVAARVVLFSVILAVALGGVRSVEAQTSGPWPPSLGAYFWRGIDGSGNGDAGDFSWEGPWVGGRWYAEGDEGCTSGCQPPTFYQLPPQDGDTLLFRQLFTNEETATPPFSISAGSHSLPNSDVSFEINATISGGSFDMRHIGIVTRSSDDFPGTFPVTFNGTSLFAGDSISAGASHDTLHFIAATLESPEINLFTGYNFFDPNLPPGGVPTIDIRDGSRVAGGVADIQQAGAGLGTSLILFDNSEMDLLGANIGRNELLEDHRVELRFSGGSTGKFAQFLLIGAEGAARMIVEGSSQIDASNAYVNVGDQGWGDLHVTGNSTLLAKSVNVGLHANGNVGVDNGGRITSDRIAVGELVGFEGTINIENDGEWETDELVAGVYGTGYLYIRNGGTLKINTSGILGEHEGSRGVLRLIGEDAKLELSSTTTLTVGEHGTGELYLEQGAKITHSGAMHVGGAAGGLGIAHLTGASSTELENLVIGHHAGSYGEYIVDDGSTLKVTNMTTVGEHGEGVLEVRGGSTATTRHMAVAEAEGSTGTATVTGTGSSLTVEDDLLIGVHSEGFVSIENGGSLDVEVRAVVGEHAAGDLEIAGGSSATVAKLEVGEGAGSQGTVTVTDAGSLLNVDTDLLVGVHGDGKVTVENGGALVATKAVIGEEAHGVLFVSNGASATLGELAVAEAAGSEGTATVTGAGSILSVQSNLLAGVHGLGQVNVENGGTLVVSGAEIVLGEESDGHGVLTISTGGNLQFTGEIIAGAFGGGVFALQAGAVYTASEVVVGEENSGVGDLNIELGSHLQVTGELIVGAHGNGSLKLGNGAMLTTHETILGEHLTSAALVEVGAEASWNTQELIVGDSGLVTMTVADGANIDAHEIIVAEHVGSLVGLAIEGDDTTVHTEGLFLGGSEMHSGGAAVVTIADGGHVHVAHELIVWETATLDSQSGGVTIGDQTTLAADGTIRVNDHGTLAGLGSIAADVLNAGGHVAPGGHDSTGTLHIDGNYTQEDHAALEIKLAAGEYDALDVSGLMSLSGELAVTTLGGFVPSLGQVFSVLDWGSISGEFEHLELPELDHALEWDTSKLYSTGALRVAAVTPGDFNGDGHVDGGDYTTWQNTFGSTTMLGADGNGDGVVDAADYTLWRDSFHSLGSGGLGPAAVPEPCAATILGIAAVVCLAAARKRNQTAQAQ